MRRDRRTGRDDDFRNSCRCTVASAGEQKRLNRKEGRLMRLARWLLLAIAMIAIGGGEVMAQTPAPLPGVNLGATSFLDGAPPAGPGLYLSQYVQYFTSDEIKGSNGGTLPLPGPQLDVWVSLTQFIYMWEYELPGHCHPALDVLIPALSADFDLAAPGPPGLSADNGGLGDILIGPALQFDPIMGDNGPLFVHRFEAQFIIPTGEYDRNHILNAGSNYFSFNPYWAGTVFLTNKTTASFRAHYLWNAENKDPWIGAGPGVTDTKAGQAFHINFAAEHEVIEKMLRVGINGYYLKQTTDAQVNGADVSGTREQVLGIGPGAILSFSQKQHVFCNLYWETEAENRAEGFRLNLRYVQKF